MRQCGRDGSEAILNSVSVGFENMGLVGQPEKVS
jgi:hypothetical protein